MNTHADKTQENKRQSLANAPSQKQSNAEPTFQLVDNRPEAIVQRTLQEMANDSPQAKQAAQLQSITERRPNNVKVHYNSDKPATVQAHAYAQGTDIHLGAGQEKHLPHEASHVVQQKQGRVKPTTQMKPKVNINDDSSLESEADKMGAKAASNGAQQEMTQLKQKEIESASATQRVVQKATGDEGEETTGVEVKSTTDVTEATKKEETAGTEEEVSAAETQELGEATSDEGELTTAGGLEISSTADKKEKVELVKKGDTIVKDVTSVGTIAKGTYSIINTINESTSPSTEGASILEKTTTVFEKASSSVTGVMLGLIKPIIDAGLGVLGMKNRWSQWSAFKKSAVEVVGGKEKARDSAPAEATYGLGKALSGFLRFVKTVFMNLWNFTANLLTLIPGAVVVGVPMKAFHMVSSLVEAVYKGGKSIYQYMFGEKKDTNSTSLLDKALTGDNESLNLIFDLKLGSIAGSGFKAFDWLSNKINEVSLANMAHKVGITSEKAERIIDKMGAGSGGPENAAELKTQLLFICGNSPASKELIRKEIREAMTGFGT